jgi:formylglycine-generating enzyme required for sulfatase activity
MDMEKPGLPFEGFISYLRRQGFIIGVDHYLRLQELLNKLGPGCEPAGMKYLLCPIFAVNEKQQQQFYRAFDLYFKSLDAAAAPSKEYPAEKTGKKEIVESPEVEVTPPKWQYILLGTLLVILAVILFYQWGERLGKKSDSKGTVTAAQPDPKNNIPIITQREKPDEQKKLPPFFQKYRYIFRWVGLLAPFIVFLLIEGYKYNRRRLILVRQRGKKPPLVWPIKVEATGTGFLKNDWFYRAARFLRKRIKSDIIGLDLEKTISGTIENAGVPELRYKSLTRPPEYLILIDLAGYRDHYAHLWDSLVRALAGEGVYVTRYFYEQDPRVCFKEPDGQREYLSALKTRYSDYRLIICGDGEGLLDPLTGELDKWTGLFKAWRERALLAPKRPRDWSWKEIVMAGEFILVPATLEGLCALEDYWELPMEPGLKTWKQADEKFPFLSPGREEQVEELLEYLGKDTFQWLCACAVYPELHWDLTLYLGTLPCMPGNLLDEENVLRLLSLPWFRTGTIPDELRWELISRLETGISRDIRSAIVELLEKNPALTDSFAYETYRLHLVVQRWMLSREDRKKRKAVLKSLKSIGEKRFIQDYIMLRFMESVPTTPLHFVLPQQLRKLVFRKGVPFFGFKTGIRVALTILIAINLFLFFKGPDFNFNKILIAAVVDLMVLIAVVLFLYFKDYDSDKPIDIAPAISPAIRSSADMYPDGGASAEMPREVRQAAQKAVKVYINEKGFWEADYGDGIIMIYIPEGWFTMGSNEYDAESPLHTLYLNGYWIGRNEVIVSQYMQFVKDTKSHYPEWLEKGIKYNIRTINDYYYEKFISDKNSPIVGISWFDARAYCNWLSNKTGLHFTLPTEPQWEKAARGIDGRKYPWGNEEPDETLANFGSKIGKTTPRGSYPKGASPYGLLDIAGNVWEWCNDWYKVGYYISSSKKKLIGPGRRSFRGIRGGSWCGNIRDLRCAYRYGCRTTYRCELIGFRLCMEVSEHDL